MEFSQVIDRALEIRHQYAKLEQEKYGRSWTSEEIALGFVGDVGDLSKLVMAMNEVRNIPDARQKLAHELSDCLWSIIVLANQFDVDLEGAFLQTMNDLEGWIASHMSS